MPSAAYFRRQADICLRLSLIASDDAISTRLVTMAKEYLATGEALERQAEPGSPYLDAGDAAAGADGDSAIFDVSANASGTPGET
jgi:hypothetical protein